jgi:peptidoglycan/xylan/chitin deacetylase (PgdA/CDA1 family)
MDGDGVAENNLRENPAAPQRVQERNIGVESEFEYGSRVGFWRLFKMFNEYKMKFTLYAVAKACERNPQVPKRCVDMGHDVASQ